MLVLTSQIHQPSVKTPRKPQERGQGRWRLSNISSEWLTVAIVHYASVDRVVNYALRTRPVDLTVALKHIVAATFRAACARGVLIRARDDAAPANSHFVFASRSRLVDRVAVGLSLAPKQVVVVPVVVYGGSLCVVVAGWLVLDLVCWRLGDGESLGAKRDLIDITPIRPESEVISVIHFIDRGVDCVVRTAIRGGESDRAMISPGSLAQTIAGGSTDPILISVSKACEETRASRGHNRWCLHGILRAESGDAVIQVITSILVHDSGCLVKRSAN